MHKYLIAAFVGVILVTLSTGTSSLRTSRAPLLLLPPSELPRFALGHQETLADAIWIRLIQDFDLCEKDMNSDRNKISGPGSLPGVGRSRCDRGWVYRMLDSITELAPRFLGAYEFGGTMLSIVVDDREGARLIFDKGLSRFPNDWVLNYRAGYHYLYEIKDLEKSAELMNRAAANGAPPWLHALAARLYTRVGKAQLGKSVLEDALRRDPHGPGAERITQRLKEINAELESATKANTN